MAIINFERNFIFIHPRRSGGSSLFFALLKYCSSRDLISDDTIVDYIGLSSLASEFKKDNGKSLSTDKRAFQILKEAAEKPTNAAIDSTSDKLAFQILKESEEKTIKKLKLKKKFNFRGYINFFASFIKIIPFAKSIFKFNNPPNFNLPKFLENDVNLYSHIPVSKVKKIVGDKFFENAFKFTIIRNPYDQILSFYFAYHKNKNFKQFIKNESSYFFNKESELVFLKNQLPYNKIIRYENLENDLTDLSEFLKLPENLFEVFKNLNIHKVKKDYSLIDYDSQEIIYKNAYKFFKEFNYSKNIKL
jgi:hypothetical protein